MYITQLENYSEIEWTRLLSLVDELHRDRLKQILTLPSKNAIESEFEWMKNIGFINGIGASWMGNISILIISSLFRGVRYEFHDILYAVGGKESDRIEADNGLFKYSMITIYNNYKKLSQVDIFPVVNGLFILLYTFFAVLQFLILVLFWRILYYTGGKAFNYKI